MFFFCTEIGRMQFALSRLRCILTEIEYLLGSWPHRVNGRDSVSETTFECFIRRYIRCLPVSCSMYIKIEYFIEISWHRVEKVCLATCILICLVVKADGAKANDRIIINWLNRNAEVAVKFINCFQIWFSHWRVQTKEPRAKTARGV